LVGDLRLKFEALSISGVVGQRIYVYTPLPGTPGITELRALADQVGDEAAPPQSDSLGSRRLRSIATPIYTSPRARYLGQHRLGREVLDNATPTDISPG
jgi:hypothetical protein